LRHTLTRIIPLRSSFDVREQRKWVDRRTRVVVKSSVMILITQALFRFQVFTLSFFLLLPPSPLPFSYEWSCPSPTSLLAILTKWTKLCKKVRYHELPFSRRKQASSKVSRKVTWEFLFPCERSSYTGNNENNMEDRKHSSLLRQSIMSPTPYWFSLLVLFSSSLCCCRCYRLMWAWLFIGAVTFYKQSGLGAGLFSSRWIRVDDGKLKIFQRDIGPARLANYSRQFRSLLPTISPPPPRSFSLSVGSTASTLAYPCVVFARRKEGPSRASSPLLSRLMYPKALSPRWL